MAELGSPHSPLFEQPTGAHDGSSDGEICNDDPLFPTYAMEQDMYLPIANISRIMKRSLPANAKITKDAKDAVQECLTEFIGFITSEASDKCHREKRKTINGDDIIWAMTTLGFDNYVQALKIYLQRFRDVSGPEGDTRAGLASRGTVDTSSKEETSGASTSDIPTVQE